MARPATDHSVGPGTTIMPVLNGMAKLDRLEESYPGQVLGGLARIVATLEGDVVYQKTHLTSPTIGDLTAGAVAEEVRQALTVPGIDLSVVDDVVGALWKKWAFIAAAGAVNCLFRAPVWRILEASGHAAGLAAIDELEAVAAGAGYPVSAGGHAQAVGLLTEPGSAFTSSLYRGLTAELPSEAEHILGGFASRARALGIQTPMLDLALIQIRANSPI